MKHHILFIDDEGWFLKPYISELEKDFEVHFCSDVTQGQKIISKKVELKVLILDIMMPTPEGVAASATKNGDSTGVWFLKQILNTIVSRPLPVVILTNRGKSLVTKEVSKIEIDANLVKIRTKTEAPPDHLRKLVKEMIDTWHP